MVFMLVFSASRANFYYFLIVFRRIYSLRDQIMHGGTPWQGKVNRSQLKDSVALLKKIVPVMLELMLNHNENEW